MKLAIVCVGREGCGLCFARFFVSVSWWLLLKLYSCCRCCGPVFMCLFLVVSWIYLLSVILVFPGYILTSYTLFVRLAPVLKTIFTNVSNIYL